MKRIVFALIILPVAIGFIGVLINNLKRFSSSYIPFLLGIACYTLIYPVFRKPLTSYVIGHELTHVLGVWLLGGRIHSLRIGRYGGTVKTNKINTLTALLPYFFPLYTALVLGIYLILSILWDMGRFHNWLVFFLGMTWAFHIWMTIYILRRNQPDIRYSGLIFSMVVIFTINVAVLTLLLVFISPELNLWDFINQSVQGIKEPYIWLLKRLV